ncbi:hypothetical protein [Roseinatronobacter monicus]|uniref:TnsA endonuclease-like protein n=1 Tax=Roseinatronobacter monicus TaxID=393481 RepID=A0A543KDU8_9RHOB|nr:hypothetical protein [Roseinatronobacter monicus]TQM93265.1 hypothetical protein BD293_1897 [Roseinatronobacter monicus]
MTFQTKKAGFSLPAASRAMRNVPMASAGHCTTHVVLGDGAGVHVQGESILEMRLQFILNARREVADMREQVRFFYGWNPAKQKQHVFDLVVTLVDGTVIAYAIKPEVRLESGRFMQEMQEVAWWVRTKGFADDVRIMSDADIQPVALHNAHIIAALRGHDDPEADLIAHRVVMDLESGAARSLRSLTIETGLSDRGYRGLLGLVRKGILEPLSHEKIRPETLMRRART